MAMAMAMAKQQQQQRSKSNWEGMLKWCSRSAHSDGTPPHHHRPAHWEGMLKWRGEAQQQPKKHWMVTVKEVSEEEGLDALEPPNNNKLTQIDHDQQQLTTTDVTSLQNTIHVLNNSVQHLTEQVKTMFQQLQTALPVDHRQAQPLLIQDDSPAHDSDGTHHTPARRWEEEGMSKPLWSLEQQEPPPPLPSGGGILQDDRPAYSPPPPPYYGCAAASSPPPISPRKWEEGMSKPLWSLQQESPPSGGGGIHDYRPAHSPPLFYYGCTAYPPCPPPPPFTDPSQKYIDMGLLRPLLLPLEFSEGGIQDAHSDGTPAQRWWEVKFKKPWRLPPSGTSGIPVDDRPPPPPQLSMVGSNSNWEGRLKRWRRGHTFGPYPNYSLEDLVARRVNEIAQYFKVPEYPDDSDDPDEIDILVSEQFEYWLDEVQGYFEFMDLAHELHSIDCLFPLLHHVLVYPHPHAACTRAKTAELVTTMVHNNPRSQQLVMELHGLQPLWYNFTSDSDATSRSKALGAISALIRNNKPGITAFRETNGYAALGDALSSENVWFQRKALNLIQYLLHENSSDCNTVTELGLPRIMMHLASSDDAEVRVAALGGLLVLARDEECTYQKKKR